jgi:hypothetical protein
MATNKIHELCAGGGCCPVLVEQPDRTLSICEDGQTLVSLSADQADRLARVLASLGYGKEDDL